MIAEDLIKTIKAVTLVIVSNNIIKVTVKATVVTAAIGVLGRFAEC